MEAFERYEDFLPSLLLDAIEQCHTMRACVAVRCTTLLIQRAMCVPGCAEVLEEDARHNLELQRQQQQQQQQLLGLSDGGGTNKIDTMAYPMLGWVPSNNPYEKQWQVVPLRAASSSDEDDTVTVGGSAVTVDVDMSAAPWLSGREPLAIRLGWPLFGIPYSPADTCCPSATVQNGRGVCIPGNCPLYSEVSELPANPFFALIKGGKCECPAPQVCSA